MCQGADGRGQLRSADSVDGAVDALGAALSEAPADAELATLAAALCHRRGFRRGEAYVSTVIAERVTLRGEGRARDLGHDRGLALRAWGAGGGRRGGGQHGGEPAFAATGLPFERAAALAAARELAESLAAPGSRPGAPPRPAPAAAGFAAAGATTVAPGAAARLAQMARDMKANLERAGVTCEMLSLGRRAARATIAAVGGDSAAVSFTTELWGGFVSCVYQGGATAAHSAVATGPGDLLSRRIEARAAAKASLQATARPLERALRVGPVALSPEVAAYLLELLEGAVFTGRPGHGASPRRGVRCGSPAVTIVDDGLLPGGTRTQPVDDVGRGQGRRAVIERGVFTLSPAGRGAVQRRPSLWDPPRPAATNLFLSPDPAGGSAAIAAAAELYVDHVLAQGPYDPASGTASIVAVGVLRAGGRAVGPFTFTVRRHDLWRRVTAVGPDLEWHGEGGNIGAPLVLVEHLRIAPA